MQHIKQTENRERFCKTFSRPGSPSLSSCQGKVIGHPGALGEGATGQGGPEATPAPATLRLQAGGGQGTLAKDNLEHILMQSVEELGVWGDLVSVKKPAGCINSLLKDWLYIHPLKTQEAV